MPKLPILVFSLLVFNIPELRSYSMKKKPNASINKLYVESTPSTNLLMAQQIKSIHEEGYIVQTGFQTAGRGQAGNYWESEADKNALFSMALFPQFLAPTRQFMLSKAVSLGVVQSLNELKEGFKIKWPNDIYFENKKLAGILIETAIMGNTLKHAIVGIGLNVNQENFELAPAPISLKQLLQKDFDVDEILYRISESVLTMYTALANGEDTRINESYFEHLYRNKGEWKFKDAQGYFWAIIQSVMPDGQLILQLSTGEQRRYWMKEVEFILE